MEPSLLAGHRLPSCQPSAGQRFLILCVLVPVSPHFEPPLLLATTCSFKSMFYLDYWGAYLWLIWLLFPRSLPVLLKSPAFLLLALRHAPMTTGLTSKSVSGPMSIVFSITWLHQSHSTCLANICWISKNRRGNWGSERVGWWWVIETPLRDEQRKLVANFA